MTKRNNKSKSKNKTKQNPLTHKIIRNPRPKVHFDGQILNGTGYMVPNASLINLYAGMYAIDCSNTAGTIVANQYIQSTAYDLLAITKLYNEFVYHSVRYDWVPNVSPGVADGGSQIYIGYIDNAEEIVTWVGAAVGTAFNIAKTGRNTKFFNAWERFSYNVPVSHKQKTFDTNYNLAAYSDSNVNDRSVQGAVVFGASTLSAAVTLGQWRVTYVLELRGLNVNMNV